VKRGLLLSLTMTWTPWQFMMVAIAGCMNRQQQEAIAYLKVEATSASIGCPHATSPSSRRRNTVQSRHLDSLAPVVSSASSTARAAAASWGRPTKQRMIGDLDVLANELGQRVQPFLGGR